MHEPGGVRGLATLAPIAGPNKQAPEKPSYRSDGSLDVVEVFSTIQGEGPFAGRPAIFVRTAGCDLQCPLCDTDYTSNRELLCALDLYNEVKKICPRKRGNLVVLTGGEPLRQGCGPFVRLLLKEGFQVQVETNGTLYDPTLGETYDHPRFTLGCSPKTAKLHPKLWPSIDYLKYVVKAGEVDPLDGLPTSSLNYGLRPARPTPDFLEIERVIYLQPCDEGSPEKNAKNIEAAVDSCLQFGYTLSLQLHKIVGLP